jgi:hypothetical protein
MPVADTEHWLHGAAVAIHDSERPIAVRGLRESPKFKTDLVRALRLHRTIVDILDRFVTAAVFGDPVLAGAWRSADYYRDAPPPHTAVASLPSLQRHHDIEKPLQRLGELLGHTTKALSVSVRGPEHQIELVWHDEDVERLDITEERTLVDLLERLRWETDEVVIRRFHEINEALRAGRVPGPPAYRWPTT